MAAPVESLGVGENHTPCQCPEKLEQGVGERGWELGGRVQAPPTFLMTATYCVPTTCMHSSQFRMTWWSDPNGSLFKD